MITVLRRILIYLAAAALWIFTILAAAFAFTAGDCLDPATCHEFGRVIAIGLFGVGIGGLAYLIVRFFVGLRAQ